jgi:hypothetical protein
VEGRVREEGGRRKEKGGRGKGEGKSIEAAALFRPGRLEEGEREEEEGRIFINRERANEIFYDFKPF